MASLKKSAGKIAKAAKRTTQEAGASLASTTKNSLRGKSSQAKIASSKIDAAKAEPRGPSATNLILADVALRGGGRLLRHVVERTLLGVKYSPDKAREIVKSRSITQSLLGSAAARLATRSVPGAIVVGGGLIAKTLYDRGKSRRELLLKEASEAKTKTDKA